MKTNYNGSTFGLTQWTDYRDLFTKSIWNDERKCSVAPLKRIIVTYAIEHVPSGQAYVGSSEDFCTRWKAHLRELKKGTHYNVKLQQLFNDHEPEEFVIRIIRSYDSTDNLLQREMRASRKYGSKLLNSRIGFAWVPGYQRQKHAVPRAQVVRVGKYAATPRWFAGQVA